MKIISHLPIFFTAFFFALLGALVLAIIRKWVALHLLTSHHEVAFPIFLQLGVIYAVLIAFIFSMVLEDINNAYSEARMEATKILNLAQLAPGFPPEVRKKIDENLLEYTTAVIEDEWPRMAKGHESLRVSRVLVSLQRTYLNIKPQSLGELARYENSLQYLGQLRESRRLRVFTAIEPKLTDTLALLCILGAIVVGISFFFGMHRLWAQMILTGSLIFAITSILLIMYMFSTPFSGRFAIKPYVYKDTLTRLNQIILLEH
jgi:hypothetical protein